MCPIRVGAKMDTKAQALYLRGEDLLQQINGHRNWEVFSISNYQGWTAETVQTVRKGKEERDRDRYIVTEKERERQTENLHNSVIKQYWPHLHVKSFFF